MKIVLIIFFIGLVTITSCNRPECTNTNPVFTKYQPTDEPYKAELAKQLGLLNPEALRYWFKEYNIIDGKALLTVNVQGNDLCAVMVLSGRQWPKLEPVINKKGMSYQGAELLGLSFDVQQNEQTEFIYRDILRIVD